MSASSYREVPVFFAAGADTLFGIVTVPSDGCARTGLIIFPGGGTPFSVNRNRVSVRICRELASMGYAGFRPDYHGAGESTGASEKLNIAYPHVDDAAAAALTLRNMGAEHLILAGSCFGGRTALAATALDNDVEALILIATPLHDYMMGERKSAHAAATWTMGRYVRESLHLRRIRGLFNARSRRSYAKYARAKLGRMGAGGRATGQPDPSEVLSTEEVSPHFERQLRPFLDRGGRVLFIFGADDSAYEEFRGAAAGPLADILGEAHDGVEVTVVPGKIHGFLSVRSQDAVVDEIVRWMGAERWATALVPHSGE